MTGGREDKRVGREEGDVGRALEIVGFEGGRDSCCDERRGEQEGKRVWRLEFEI